MSRAIAARFGVPLGILTTTALLAFNASAQVFFSDFNSGVPAGASIPAGPAADPNEAVIEGGYLKLTKNVNSASGTFYVDDFTGGPITRFTATFKASLFGSVCCGAGTRPADGFSFNLVPAATVNPNPAGWIAEEGLPEGLAVNFDTWDNTVPGEPSIEVKWKGVVVPGTKRDIQPSQSPLGITDPVAASKDVFINLDPDGKITVTYGGVVICNKVQTPYNATEIGTPKWVFGARTGGANDNHWIDDLKIVTVAPDVQVISPTAVWAYNDATVDPGLKGTGWEGLAYDTNSVPGWKNGEALLGNDAAGLYDGAGSPYAGRGVNGFTTPLDRLINGTAARVTFYFRAKFNWSGPVAGVALNSRAWIDDGILAYVNGTESYRLRVPAAPAVLDWSTLGSNPATEGAPEDATWTGGSLVQGENVIAVELHQSGTASSDVAFGLSLSARPAVPATISDPTEPADRVVFASRSATLTVSAYGSPAPTYQWYKDGVAIDPAANATATSPAFVIPIMGASDAGNYYCTVSNPLGSVNSRTAVIGYLNDPNPPVVVRATASATFDKVVVEFDEIIDPNTAMDPFAVSISGGVAIAGVAPNPGNRSLTITIDPAALLQENTLYTVTVESVADLSGNVIAGNNTADFRTFVVGPGGGILFEAFPGIAGNLVTDLTAHPSFPNSPTDRITIAGFNSRLAYPDDSHETYGARMRGLFIPPVSGNWVLYMAADDGSQLKFNPAGPNAAGAQILLTRNACCGDYTSANSRTAPQALTAGQGYYIELLYKEGGGGDWGQVAAVLEGQPVPPLTEYIPGSQLGVPSAPAGVGGALTVSQPANASVLEQTPYTFSVVASNPNGLPIAYQWSRDGVAIAGATGPSYTALAVSTDNGATFTVTASMIGAQTTTAPATLTVTQDTEPPILLSATGSGSMDRIVVKYNELMAAQSAADPFNYALSPAIGIAEAKLLPDGKTVVLVLSGVLAENTTYTVTANNVSDRAVNPNTLVSGSATFSMKFAPNFLNFAAYHGTATPSTAGQIPGNLSSDLIAHPSFPDNPTESFLLTVANSRQAYPNDAHEQYGAKFSGVFVPATSGNWIFYFAADDGSQLYLNPTGIDPAGKQSLMVRDVCCGDYTAANSATAPQALTAGQRYYIEMIYKEGGGGDWGQVAARLEGQPVPPISEVLSGGQIGTFVPTAPATITITQQPVDIAYYIDPSSPSGSGSALFNQDFNSSNGGFTSTGAPAAFTGAFAYNAAAGSWQVNASDADIGVPYTSRLQSPTLTTTKTGRARLTLVHRWSVETDSANAADYWDGTQVRVSINGGAFTAVPASAFTSGGYNGLVRGGSASVIQGQSAWVQSSPGHAAGTFVTSIAELGALNAGDTVQVELVYAGDTNTKGVLLPSWEINSIGVTEGGQDPVLRLTATVVPNQTLYYQWQRNDGAGYVDVAGATGPSYTLNPTLADNGAKFRALVYVPGTYVTSSESTLTVIQLNTPPRFNAGPSQAVNEDAGSQIVANWATDILPYSIGLQSATFSTPPAGGILGGNAAITGGILHLTDAVNSQQSSYATPASPVPVDSFTLTFKARIGGGTCCGARTADGWSVSIGDIPIPVTFPIAAEEGAGMNNGLAINFDSWDNGGLADDDAHTAPNVDVKVGGNVVAYTAFAGEREGGRPPSGPIPTDPATGQPMSYQTGTAFTDVRIRVDADGTVDVDFKGVRVVNNVQTGLTFPLNNARIAFGARTGGANDNHWIDDMLILGYYNDALVSAYPVQTASAAEAGQTVQFLVSNNNPSLFSAQPAIAPDGTLSYTPAPNANGVATVTVVAKDSGGTIGGGDDTSNPVTFTITVNAVNDCPTAGSQTVSASSGVAKSITLTGSDVDGDALQYAVVQPPAHGVLIVQPNGAASYTSAVGYSGPDSFRYTVTDGTCVSSAGVVTINVLSANTAPTARIVATPLVDFSPDIANKVVISGNGTNGCLTLDGSLSSDAESPITDLTFAWAIEPGLPFATGVNASICLELGTHTIGLTVKDPQGLEGHDTLTVEVISAGEAIEDLINRVNDSTIARNNKRPFIASLKAAAASADRGNNEAAANQLHAFQNKVRAQVSKSNPAEAAIWTRWAQSIIDALNAGQ